MSFCGQVLCQRMAIGPWALTIAGNPRVAAPAAAGGAAFQEGAARDAFVLPRLGLLHAFPLAVACGGPASDFRRPKSRFHSGLVKPGRHDKMAPWRWRTRSARLISRSWQRRKRWCAVDVSVEPVARPAASARSSSV